MTTDNKATDKKTEKKPVLGLKPRHIHDTLRIVDIHEAIGRYIEDAKQIPADWTKELLDLSKATFSK